MFSRSQTLAQADPELWQAISGENARRTHIERSRRKLREPGRHGGARPQLTNKYAEASGQAILRRLRIVDIAEQLAIDRA
jgi:hypothetical protein